MRHFALQSLSHVLDKGARRNIMGQIIDARAYFDLSSWLPDIEGMRRIEVIREWLAMEDETFCTGGIGFYLCTKFIHGVDLTRR